MIRKRTEMKVEARDKMRGGDGTVSVLHIFDKGEFGAKVRLCAELVLPPGASIGRHEHDGEDEVYLVTGGSGLLDDDETVSRVSAGDAILTGKGRSHSIRNDGEEDLKIMAVIVCY